MSFVSKRCPGIELDVGMNPRWERLCFQFRWDGFADLLPEERFRCVARLIPSDYFEDHCKGAVWLELTPQESLDEYLSQLRSEDVRNKLPVIWEKLRPLEFFSRVEDELVRIPPAECVDNLTVSKRVLRALKLSEVDVREYCLAFIGQEAYTDWEVLQKVRPVVELERQPPMKRKQG